MIKSTSLKSINNKILHIGQCQFLSFATLARLGTQSISVEYSWTTDWHVKMVYARLTIGLVKVNGSLLQHASVTTVVVLRSLHETGSGKQQTFLRTQLRNNSLTEAVHSLCFIKMAASRRALLSACIRRLSRLWSHFFARVGWLIPDLRRLAW